MPATKQIVLGCKAKDEVSGFTGIVTSRHEEFTGMIQLGLSPALDPKKPSDMPEAMSFDLASVKYVGPGLNRKVPKPEPLPFKLGDEVEDTVSGFKGIATFRTDFLNGCVQISIQHKIKAGEEHKRGKHFPLQSVRRIGNGINDPKAASNEEPARRPGGPSQKVSDI